MRNWIVSFGIVGFLISNGFRRAMCSMNEEGNLVSNIHLRSGQNNTFTVT
jgi:hypothetical protein